MNVYFLPHESQLDKNQKLPTSVFLLRKSQQVILMFEVAVLLEVPRIRPFVIIYIVTFQPTFACGCTLTRCHVRDNVGNRIGFITFL